MDLHIAYVSILNCIGGVTITILNKILVGQAFRGLPLTLLWIQVCPVIILSDLSIVDTPEKRGVHYREVSTMERFKWL